MSPAEAPQQWVGGAVVDRLIERFSEGPARAERRRRALRAFEALPLEPNPLYRQYGYAAGVDLSGIDPLVDGAPLELPAALPGAVRIVHDRSGTRVDLPDDLKELGVRVVTDPPTNGGAPEEPGDRLRALSEAVANRWCRIEVPARCPVSVRIQDLSILAEPHEAVAVRRELSAGAESHVLLSEEAYTTPAADGSGQRFLGSATALSIGAGARVAVMSLYAPDFRTVGIVDRSASVGAAARLAWIWAGFGGFRTRIRNATRLEGNGSNLSDLQTFFGVGEQSYDSAVDVTHVGTDTHGQSVTRGVFRDRSRGMSRGLVRIEREAVKTVSYLSEHAMLLSRGARSDTIPILEILCRDVKATHSTSVAPVDPEKVFYLESRGIEPSEAVRMIGEGFLSHVLERSPISGLRELAYPFLTARWDGRPIAWTEGAYPVLPEMALAGSDADPEWRFDAKLR